MKSAYKSGSVTITVDYGYDIHSTTFSGRTYKRILSGKPFTIRGQGFSIEGVREQDYWQFNLDDHNAERKGALHVYAEEGREVFTGELDDEEVSIEVFPPAD